MAVVDWTNPCARHVALTAAYYQLLAGGTEIKVRFRTDGTEEEVHYAQANLSTLRSEMERAGRECAEASGTPVPRRRFAIRAGARRDLTS